MKRFFIVLSVVLNMIIIFNLTAYRGNNRFTIWLHHGIWLPPSTTHITFNTYPGILAHLINLDDWAKTECKIPQSELQHILENEMYTYVTSIDTAENGLSWYYSMSSHRIVPDSIIKTSSPISIELKSRRGDFLMFTTKLAGKDSLYLRLYTDWN